MRRVLPLFAFVLGLTLAATARAQEVIPEPPTRFFNDYALVVKPATAAALNAKLADFERETSNQFLVCIYPRMQTPSSIEDYTGRVARSWRVGGKARDTGVILFAFLEPRRIRIEVGRGLEGPLPDSVVGRIIREEIGPASKAGNPDAAFTAGVDAVIVAAKGEYIGTGRTVYQQRHGAGNRDAGFPPGLLVLVFLGVFFFLVVANRRSRRGMVFRGDGYGRMGGGGFGPIIMLPPGGGFGGGGGGGGFGGGGGGGSSDDGGSFEAGGGDFGGGGASGDW